MARMWSMSENAMSCLTTRHQITSHLICLGHDSLFKPDHFASERSSINNIMPRTITRTVKSREGYMAVLLTDLGK